MPTVLTRVLGLVAAVAVILAIASPTGRNVAIATWSVLAAVGVLIATYTRSETVGVRTDVPVPSPRAGQPTFASSGDRARAAILDHFSRRPVEALPLLASFMRSGTLDSSEMTPAAAPANVARRVRALTDARALELAELLGLDLRR